MTDDQSPNKRRRRRRRRSRGDDAQPGSGNEGASARRDGGASAGAEAKQPASGDGAAGNRRRRRPRGSKDGGARRPRRDSKSSGAGKRRDSNNPPAPRLDVEPQKTPLLRREDFDIEEDERFVPDNDDSEPAKVIELAPDLPAEDDDSDPSTADWQSTFQADTVADVVGVTFASAGKIYVFDSGKEVLERGASVIVDSDRGPRWGTVAVGTQRTSHSRKQLRRVLRRPNADDVAKRNRASERDAAALLTAKQIARERKLPIKVFRCEISETGGRAVVYFSSEGRVDARPLVRDLSKELACRVDTKQTGVRDEARLVGGIGSCGQELCCTTWLPSFVPVSIKHAKDQGLVLNPTKVSGQCGRLKCCLVYEHATYAELRKGLPRLGKRVVTDDGEGRVVEVDVLRQRVRVSLVEGTVKVYGKGEVEPLFPSQKPNQPTD